MQFHLTVHIISAFIGDRIFKSKNVWDFSSIRKENFEKLQFSSNYLIIFKQNNATLLCNQALLVLNPVTLPSFLKCIVAKS